MRYKAILFDMDGVLIESEWLMRETSIQSLAEHGVRARHEDFLEFTGCGEDRFISGVAEKYGLAYDASMKERAYDFYGERAENDTNVPRGVKQMLQTLRERGFLLAVCTAADRRKAMYNLKAIGVTEELFTAFITGSEVERKKPNPDIYLEGARRVGVLPEECLVVEDAINGIKAAHAGGMHVAVVPTTFTRQQLLEEKPEYFLEEVSELTQLKELL